MEKFWKKLWENEKIRQMFRKENLLVLILSGILLMVIVWPIEGKKKETSATQESVQIDTTGSEAIAAGNEMGYQTYGAFLEERLENVLSTMEGVGEVSVMLTFHSSDERIILKDEESSSSEDIGTEEQSNQTQQSEMTVFYTDQEGNELPYETTVLYPKVEGVVVVAQGADNPVIVVQITEVVQALFDLEIHKIRVVTMKSE